MFKKIKDLINGETNLVEEDQPTTLAGLKSADRAVEAPDSLPEANDAQAIFDYAFYYEFNAPEKDLDLERAGYYYRKAARLGHVQAAYRLGKYYANPSRRDGICKDLAAFWYTKAAQNGHEKARTALKILELKKESVKLSLRG